ncbi:MAG TPA: flagellar export chaperone FliS [Methylomirabilota bacterium]|jgi:flagellar protein FliS|nr:flagellar export chaperone FliS [Methylomirabilota bacterium]HZT36149.1 flagellar export chaperone FliS [Nitrososphaera sp.]
MSHGRHVQAYRANQVMTADPGVILLLLYQGAIDFLRQAKDSLEKKNMAAKGQAISKALAIISELLASLNFEVGGEVARNLESLYLFMIDHITQANLHNDPTPLDETITLLSTLKEGWDEAVAMERKRLAQEAVNKTSIDPQPVISRSHATTLIARA